MHIKYQTKPCSSGSDSTDSSYLQLVVECLFLLVQYAAILCFSIQGGLQLSPLLRSARTLVDKRLHVLLRLFHDSALLLLVLLVDGGHLLVRDTHAHLLYHLSLHDLLDDLLLGVVHHHFL